MIKAMKQTELKVFKGPNIPFTKEEARKIGRQLLRATHSANLPERWIEDPEVIAAFLVFRSTALDVLPSRRQLGGSLLNDFGDEVEGNLLKSIRGKRATLR